MPRMLELTKDAVLPNLPLFLSFVEVICGSAGLTAEQCRDVKLAVEEACSNVITHGYAGRAPGTITLRGHREGDRLVVVVADRGQPFYPDEAPPPDLGSGWQARQVGGLGWHFIRQIADELSYQSEGGENHLTLTIALKGA